MEQYLQAKSAYKSTYSTCRQKLKSNVPSRRTGSNTAPTRKKRQCGKNQQGIKEHGPERERQTPSLSTEHHPISWTDRFSNAPTGKRDNVGKNQQGKNTGRKESDLLRSQQSTTEFLGPTGSATLLLDTLYPADYPMTDTPEQTGIRAEVD